MIYISEAHAADIWPIGLSAGVINYSHKKIEDRIKCAEQFKKDNQFIIPIYCDSIEDTFEKLYASWPFRFFVIENKKLIKIGQPEDSQFDLTEIMNL